MKILITDFVHPDLVSLLAERGHQVTSDPAISYKRLSEVIAPFEGLIVSTRLPIDKAIIDAAPNLRFIARVGSGMEHIDMLYAQEKGIRVVSSPEGNANAVAEHALGMSGTIASYTQGSSGSSAAKMDPGGKQGYRAERQNHWDYWCWTYRNSLCTETQRNGNAGSGV